MRVDADRVSRRHAVLRLEGDGWVYEDQKSRNGTFLDGRRVRRLTLDGPVELRLGDPEDGPVVELAPAASGPATPTATAAPEIGKQSAVHRPDRALVRIGRAPDNDIVLDDLLVSRRHAELRPGGDGRYEVADQGSHNGTFVNGRRVERAKLEDLDVVSIGHSMFRLVDGALEEYSDTGAVAYQARGLTVRTPTGAVVLDEVSFALQERSLLAVVGPSGAGKSTLLNALTGFRPATEGSVLYGPRDLYAEYDDLRRRIGFVPQDDVVHPELSVRRALAFAAELRFPPDVGRAERLGRVDEVIADLGLTARRDLPIRQLSGGQRKRASVALELLTRPSLLFLDEPTSGLDPGYERGLMELLRQLADGGRTVVVVTHSVQSLRLCDRVLFLAPGGKTAYFGPPQLALAYFGCEDHQEVFRALSAEEGPDWKERFRTHEDHQQFVEQPMARTPAQQSAVRERPGAGRQRGWLRQLATLTRRYAAVVGSDRRYLALLLAQAPLLGLLMLVALPAGELAPPGATEVRLLAKAGMVLLVVSLGATWLGASNAVREIVKELPVFRRERAVGLSISAYVASKAIVLAGFTVLQAVVLVVLAVARQDGPPDASVLGWPLGELMIAVALAGLAAMALGLLVSALSATVDRATTLLPVVLILQLVLALGGLFPEVVDKPVLRQLSYASSAQWGFAATASTADLNELQAVTGALREVPSIDLRDPQPALDAVRGTTTGEPLWDHEAGAWLTSVAALVALTAAALVATGMALLRYDPEAT